MTLRIHALGPFYVTQNNTLVPDGAWKTQKNKALLKLLLTYRGHPLDKDRLIEWLWPERDVASAGRDLRVAISQLRGLLEPDLPHGSRSTCILTTDSGYAWNKASDYWLDADDFERRSHALLSGTGDPLDPQIISETEQALALYRGDYLEEDRYADWPIAERERLRELYFSMLTTLAEAYARQGRYGRAATLCRRVLLEDGCRENVWCQLMLYHYHAGDQVQALRAYEECSQMLAKELGVEPLPETTALARQIRERSITRRMEYPAPADIERLRHLPLSLGRTPLVGREPERARLLEQLEMARRGHGRVVLIEGEAGVGKSRLGEEVLAEARQHGATVIGGSCREGASRPYQPVIEAVQQAFSTRRQSFDRLPTKQLAALSGLLPEICQAYPALATEQLIPSLSPEQERAGLFDALAISLQTIAGEGALLCLALDDIHWADPATLDFLDYFAPYLASSRVLVLCVLRSEEANGPEANSLADWLWSVRKKGILYRVRLQPLPVEDVELLVYKLCGSLEQSKALGERLFAETDGNPLFLLSVLQSLFEDGLLVAGSDGGWMADLSALPEPGSAALPPTVQQVILHRLRRLGSAERETLEAAAVLGRRFEWPVLHGMRSWRRDVLFDNLDRLKEALLVRQHGPESFSFSHDKVCQAVYIDTAPAVRAWLHGKAGESLETVYADRLDELAGAIASHYQQSGMVERAFAYHLRAGAYAARLYANSEAIQHYQAALALTVGGQGSGQPFQPPAESLREANAQLGSLFQIAGRYAQAEAHLFAALDVAAMPTDRLILLYKLAHSHDRQGRRQEATRFLRQAVAEADALSNVPAQSKSTALAAVPAGYAKLWPDLHSEAARIYARWAIFNSSEHGAERSSYYAGRAITMLGDHLSGALQGSGALHWSEYDTVQSVLTNAGESFRLWADWGKARELFEQALVVAERQNDPVGVGYALHNLADVLLAEGSFSMARDLYGKAAEAFRQSHQVWEEMASLTHLGLAWACEGQWGEAATLLASACAVGEEMEPTEWLAETYLWRWLAEHYSGGSGPEMEAYRARSCEIVQATGQPLAADITLLVEAAAALRDGYGADAQRHLQQGVGFLGSNDGRAFYGPWIVRQLTQPK